MGFGASATQLETSYKPRMHMRMVVPSFGASRKQAEQLRGTEAITIDVRLYKAQWVKNSYLHADELLVEAEWLDVGVDPRLLKNAVGYFFLENGEIDFGKHQPRFVGIAKDVSRRSEDGGGFSVSITFHDYTALFLDSQPYPSDGVPKYTDTITSAWQKVCDYTGWFDKSTGKIVSNVTALRDRLVAIGDASVLTLPLEKAVAPRLAALGAVPAKLGTQSTNAWDVWTHVCGMLGLITYIDGDTCVVTTTTEHYAQDNPVVFTFGSNITEVSEKVNTAIAQRGICLQSFDPLKGTVLESFFPPPGDPRVFVKRTVANRKNFNPTSSTQLADQYDYFEYHQVTDQATLDKVCEAAYLARARQELEGSLKTPHMLALTAKGDTFDLLNLKAGDPIRVIIDDDSKEYLSTRLDNEYDRTLWLLSRGYTLETAQLIAQNLEALKTLDNGVHVKQITVEYDNEHFEIEIHYCNMIGIQSELP